MRILLVNDALEGGGAELVFRKTGELLRRENIQVELFTAAERPTPSWSTVVGYVHSIKTGRRLQAVLERFQPQIVHLHNYYHLLSPGILYYLKQYRRKHLLRVVCTLHDYHLICANNSCIRWKGDTPSICEDCAAGQYHHILKNNCDVRNYGISILKYLQHAINYQLCHLHTSIDHFVSPSNYLKSRHCQLLPESSISVVYNPVFDFGKLNLTQPEPGDSTAGDYPDIFIGRIAPEKGLHRFLEEDFNPDKWGALQIIGDGDSHYLQRLKKILKHRGLENKVQFTGRLDHESTLKQLSRANRLIFPSIWYENCPLVILEALQFGKQVFHYGIGAVPEIISAVSGDPKLLREENYLTSLLKIYDKLCA